MAIPVNSSLDMQGASRITNLPQPLAYQDAVSKTYTDGVSSFPSYASGSINNDLALADNVALITASVVSGTVEAKITGFAVTGTRGARSVVITNRPTSTGDILLMHEDAGSAANNRILLPHGAASVKIAKNTSITLAYDLGTNRWVIAAAGDIGTSLAIASTPITRDGAGRARVVTPVDPADIATKGYVDGITAGGVPATALPTPLTLMARDSGGRSQVVDPLVNADIATKNYVEGAQQLSIYPQGTTQNNVVVPDSVTRLFIRPTSSGGAISITGIVASPTRGMKPLTITSDDRSSPSSVIVILRANNSGSGGFNQFKLPEDLYLYQGESVQVWYDNDSTFQGWRALHLGGAEPFPYTTARRDGFGQVNVRDAISDYGAINKRMFDAALAPVVAGTPNPTPNTMMKRDGNARAQVVDPVAAQDIANKYYVDGLPMQTVNVPVYPNNVLNDIVFPTGPQHLVSMVTFWPNDVHDNVWVEGVQPGVGRGGRTLTIFAQVTDAYSAYVYIDHEQTTSAAANRFSLPNGVSIALRNGESATFYYNTIISRWVFISRTDKTVATYQPTPLTIMKRETNGRAQVASPVVAADIATKGYVDGKVGSNSVTSVTKRVFDVVGTFTYTPPSNLIYARVKVQGGGGGGGGCSSSAGSSNAKGAGGGGGGYAEALLRPSDIGASQTVVVGGGGNGGTGGTTPTGGSSGAQSTFGGTLLVGGAGSGGGAGNDSAAGFSSTTPGLGGVATSALSGASLIWGSVGNPGVGGIAYGASGNGGSAGNGSGGARGRVSNTISGTYPGTDADGFGGGGSGGLSTQNGAAANGGKGAQGIVEIEEYVGLVGAAEAGINFYAGTIAPAADLGNEGDVYLRY